jgi:hypothetical protein
MGDRKEARLMWWAMNKKELAARDKEQREKIEQWAETTDLPQDLKRAFVELTVGFDKAKFMSLLPSEEVYKLMALIVLRLVAAECAPEERKDVLEKFCAERIEYYLANPPKELPRA